jgi:hypothetical protein
LHIFATEFIFDFTIILFFCFTKLFLSSFEISYCINSWRFTFLFSMSSSM